MSGTIFWTSVGVLAVLHIFLAAPLSFLFGAKVAQIENVGFVRCLVLSLAHLILTLVSLPLVLLLSDFHTLHGIVSIGLTIAGFKLSMVMLKSDIAKTFVVYAVTWAIGAVLLIISGLIVLVMGSGTGYFEQVF